jgi:hypothetical protein
MSPVFIFSFHSFPTADAKTFPSPLTIVDDPSFFSPLRFFCSLKKFHASHTSLYLPGRYETVM